MADRNDDIETINNVPCNHPPNDPVPCQNCPPINPVPTQNPPQNEDFIFENLSKLRVL